MRYPHRLDNRQQHGAADGIAGCVFLIGLVGTDVKVDDVAIAAAQRQARHAEPRQQAGLRGGG